jgi:hypothetical protein
MSIRPRALIIAQVRRDGDAALIERRAASTSSISVPPAFAS